MLSRKTLIFLAVTYSLCAYWNQPSLIAATHATDSGQIVASTIVFEPFAGCITDNKVRLRTAANTQSYIARELSAGTTVAVIGEEGNFYSIHPMEDMRGYIFETLVSDGVVTGKRVNVRLFPGLEAPVIAQLSRGDEVKVTAQTPVDQWLEVELPASCRFYLAKQFVEKKGSVQLVADIRTRADKAKKILEKAVTAAHQELEKPFESVNFNLIKQDFDFFKSDSVNDLHEIKKVAAEEWELIHSSYINKKLAFLSGKPSELSLPQENLSFEDSKTKKPVIQDMAMTAKMLSWKPMEDALFSLWTSMKDTPSLTEDEFYSDEKSKSIVLSGVVEPYNRIAKNCPGDFLLRSNGLPVAFLYSTRVDLDKFVGKEVSMISVSRPNNHFAFPAYFVLETVVNEQ